MSDQQPAQGTVGNMVDGAPWWLKAGLTMYLTVGLPTCLMVWDKLQEAGYIPDPTRDAVVALTKEIEQLKGLAIQGNAALNNLNENDKKAEERRKLWCVMKAKDEAEKKACFDVK